jgi:hypothetical protein
MPCAAVATAITAVGVPGASTIQGADPSSFWLIAALAALALVCHVLIIFGDLGHSSKAFCAYKMRRNALRNQLKRCLVDAETCGRECVRLFRRYSKCLLSHNRNYPEEPLEEHPGFNLVTTELLTRCLGPDFDKCLGLQPGGARVLAASDGDGRHEGSQRGLPELAELKNKPEETTSVRRFE